MHLSRYGEILEEEWLRLGALRSDIMLGEHVTMPNHFHGLLAIAAPRATHGVAPTSLSALVGQVKSAAARRINRERGTAGAPVWQRSYYDHVVRDDRDLARIEDYIAHNPERWASDRFFPPDET
jgi:putative transposase